jgi:hypothetical protein
VDCVHVFPDFYFFYGDLDYAHVFPDFHFWTCYVFYAFCL